MANQKRYVGILFFQLCACKLVLNEFELFQVDHQELLKLGIISFIIVTFIFEPRVIL